MAGNAPAYIEKLISPLGALIFVGLFTLAYFFFAHEGFYWIDDYGYAKYAWEINNGTFSVLQNSANHPNNPLTHRLSVFAPVALFYWLWGINIYTSTLWPLFTTLGCSTIIYLLFHKTNPQVAVAAIVLLGLYFHGLFLSTYLYPDNIVMFMAFTGAAILFRHQFQSNGNHLVLNAALFVISNFLGFLAKETMSYYLIFYVYVFALNLYQKKHTIFWFWSICFGATILGAYFGWYYFKTGDAWYRFHIIEHTNTLYLVDLANMDFTGLIKRLTYLPWLFFISAGIMVPFAFVLGLFERLQIREFLTIKQPEYYWLLLTLLVLLQFWFGSTSLQNFIPITLIPRMCMILMPPLCLAGAFGLERYFASNPKLAAFFTIIFSIASLLDQSKMLLIYVPLSLYFAWNWWKLRNPDFKVSYHLGIVVLTAVLILRPLHFMRKPSLMSFQEQDRLIKTHLNRNSGNILVIGDQWLEFMNDFHYNFEPNPHYTYVHYDTVITNPEKFTAIYLLVNRASLSNPDMAKLHPVQEPEINHLYPNKELIAQEDNVLLYRLNLN